MARKHWIFLIVILSVLLAGLTAYALLFLSPEETPEQTTPTTTAPQTSAATTPTTAPTTAPTVQTTVPTESTQTEPADTNEYFTLTFVGDCTFGTTPERQNNASAFPRTIGTDYTKPFQYVIDYFANDDCTFLNLEGVLMDEPGTPEDKTFVFSGPTAYTAILTQNSVELVTLANNHTYDFGEDGYRSTVNALKDAGVSYAERNSTTLYTTESGLTVGMYALYFVYNAADVEKDFAAMRQAGAEIIVVACHWGDEGTYSPNADQIYIAHALIDAGADIVWGHHPHVLQPIEEYGGGVIYYSLGNFSFGGNHYPYDMDTAVLQQQIIRAEDGTISLGTRTVIPCSVSSLPVQNDFQPTPCTQDDTRWQRVFDKLSGAYTGPDLDLSYRDDNEEDEENPEISTEPSETPTEPAEIPTEPTEPATEPTEPSSNPTDSVENS